MRDFNSLSNEEKQKIKGHLDKLQDVLDEYNPKSQTYNIIITVAFFAIWLVLTIAIGFWGTILAAIIFFPLSKATENKEYETRKRELACEACVTMVKCLEVLGWSIDDYRNDMQVYDMFVSRFPRMASLKLKMLVQANSK